MSSAALCQNIDQRLLEGLHTQRATELDALFRTITETASPVSMLVPSALFTKGFVNMDRSLKQKGLYVAECMAVNTFATLASKYAIGRQRPEEAEQGITPVVESRSPALPSGHTSNAFAVATSLTLLSPRLYVAIPAFAWASSVGYSRVHLGVHYPSDVLAGAVAGAGSAVLCSWLNRKLFHAPPKPRNY